MRRQPNSNGPEEPEVEEGCLELEEVFPSNNSPPLLSDMNILPPMLDEESLNDSFAEVVDKKEQAGRNSPREVITRLSPEKSLGESSYSNFIGEFCSSYIEKMCGNDLHYYNICPPKGRAGTFFPNHLQHGMTLTGMRNVFSRLPNNAIDVVKENFAEEIDFLPKLPLNDKTDGHINQFFIKKWAEEDNLSVCERELRNKPQFVGKATVYISWPRSSPMDALFDALQNFLDCQGLPINETYFWVSDYVCRQTSEEEELSWLWKCVENTERMVLLMDPWYNPEGLKWASCIQDVYYAQKSELKFDVIMSRDQQNEFELALENHFDLDRDIFKSLTELDVTRAKYRNQSEQEKILNELEQEVGVGEFNKLVVRQLQNALMELGELVISGLSQEEREGSATIHSMALVYSELGEYTKALALFQEYLANCREKLGDRHQVTLTCINNMAEVLRCMGDYERAFPLFNEAISGRWNLHESHDRVTMVALGNKAELLRNLGNNKDEAMALRQSILDASKDNLGNQETLQSVSNMVLLLEDVGESSTAVKFYEEVLVAYRETLGNHHLDTLVVIACMAMHHYKSGNYTKALSLCDEALVGRRETLGADHPHTIESIKLLCDIKEKQEVINCD